MEEIHDSMSQSMPWYRSWHKSSSHAFTHWVILIAVCVFVWFWFLIQNRNGYEISNPISLTSTNAAEAVLSFDPVSNSVNVGDVASVNILLDTAGEPIDGVDIYSMHYDPKLVQVMDDDADKKGIQIMAGDLMAITVANVVDNTAGTVKFSQVTKGGTTYRGNGLLASVHFKALSSGSVHVMADFTKGSTVDSNVAYRGKDQLNHVGEATITITK